MRSNVFGVFGAALIGALSSCVYVPPEPAPPYPYVEPDRRISTWLDHGISGRAEVDVDVARDR